MPVAAIAKALFPERLHVFRRALPRPRLTRNTSVPHARTKRQNCPRPRLTLCFQVLTLEQRHLPESSSPFSTAPVAAFHGPSPDHLKKGRHFIGEPQIAPRYGNGLNSSCATHARPTHQNPITASPHFWDLFFALLIRKANSPRLKRPFTRIQLTFRGEARASRVFSGPSCLPPPRSLGWIARVRKACRILANSRDRTRRAHLHSQEQQQSLTAHYRIATFYSSYENRLIRRQLSLTLRSRYEPGAIPVPRRLGLSYSIAKIRS